MQRPVVVVTGIAPEPMARVMVAALWDLPDAVAVRHVIDPVEQMLLRVVSDRTGELERELIPLEHACVACAVREDVVPTIERLARDGRWHVVVACLPVGAPAAQVCPVLHHDAALRRHVRVSAVVTALDAETAADDLLGDDLLRERRLHSGPDDIRGVGEVGCALVEYGDITVLTGRVEPVGHDLVRSLARPDALVVTGAEHVSGAALVEARHDHLRTVDWTASSRPTPLPPHASTRVWRLDLETPRGFHPDRLLDGIGALGSGRHRSRGCFWLPTRPGRMLVWEGSGGQLSIGDGGVWGGRPARTQLLLTGAGAAPERLLRAFDGLLLTSPETRGSWDVADDGFEAWLGPIRRAA